MSLRPSTLLAVLLVAAPALGQKIAILPFTGGPSVNTLRNQVVATLCEQAECVGQQKVNTKGHGDWAKAKKEKVAFILEGRILPKGKKKILEVSVFTKPGAPKVKKTYWLDSKGELSDKYLGALLASMNKLFGNAEAKEKPEPEEKEEPEEEEEEKPAPKEKEKEKEKEKPAPEEKKAPPPEEKEEKAEKEEKEEKPEPAPPPKKEKEKKEKPAEPPPPEEPEEPAAPDVSEQTKRPAFAAEVGFDAASKSYTYSNVTTPNLRSYSAPFIPSVALKAELYPIAFVQQGALAGLGVEAGFKLAIGLRSSRKNSDVRYPTNITQIDVAAKFQIRPSSKSDANFGPFVGFRSHAFSIAQGSDGTTLDGIPSISYSAVKIGLSGELPFGATGLLAYGRFSVMPVLSAPEVISSKFFPNGSVLGLEGGLGLGVQLPFLKALQIRAAFDFARYGLSFRAAATDTYVAEGAVDQYLGGSLGVRFTY